MVTKNYKWPNKVFQYSRYIFMGYVGYTFSKEKLNQVKSRKPNKNDCEFVTKVVFLTKYLFEP